MLSRPRGLRLLYISLAACVLLGLYWLATSEDGAVSREFRQPSPLQQQQDYYGRGLKHNLDNTVSKSTKSSIEVTKQNPVTSSPRKLQDKLSNVLQPVPSNDVLKTKESIKKHQENIRSMKSKFLQNGKRTSRTRSSALFSLADYKPGKNSRPLKYGINVTLTKLNMEFGEKPAKVKPDTKYKVMPTFTKESANTMDIVGNIKVGQTVPDHSARHILILTTWRSGSTFLGDLLNHYKGTFYYFEPLHYYSKSKNKQGQEPRQNETEFLRSLLECDFTEDNIGFLHHVSKADNKFLFKNHNFRLWNTCHNLLPQDMMCLMPEYLNKVCPLFPIKTIKTVRLQMRDIEDLIEDPALGLKVVFLVRDPRGTYNSRASGAISKWCVREECSNPAVGCDLMLDNIKTAFNMETRFPGTIKLVRYEDLSMFTEDITIDLLDFLGLPFTEEISKYINSHTNKDKSKVIRNKMTHKLEHKSSPYGTSRNSTATAFAWREKLSFDNIRKIQSACREPMKRLGYSFYENEEEVKSLNLPLLNNLDEIWPFESP